uniref:trimeric intracellular cation channel family protein n=1 Tax=Streptomyces sp. CHD11 TaxID=2741325 RepID=UPI0027E4E64F|nr:TRIC cation channel family protein [Streptomyces sp. CHD11]
MDLIAIFAFALSGAHLAVQKDFDLFGTVILAEAAGLGGGLFRDLVIGVTPIAFTDAGYGVAPLTAALLVYCTARIRWDQRLFDVADAAALGLFSITGTVKALSYGFNWAAASVLGAASAVGGGVLSCVLARETPSLLYWNRAPYSLPALTGAGGAAALHATGTLNVGTALAAALFAFGLRLLSICYDWRTPRSPIRRNPFSGMREQPAPSPPRSAPAFQPWTDETPTIHLPVVQVPKQRSSEDTVRIRLPRLQPARGTARHRERPQAAKDPRCDMDGTASDRTRGE